MRHLDTSYLWLQQDCIKEKISFNKVKGTENPADMNTKGLSEELILKYTNDLNMKFEEGRSELAPEVVSMLHKNHCKRFNSCEKMVSKRVRIKDSQSTINAVENTSKNNETCNCMDRYCNECACKFA